MIPISVIICLEKLPKDYLKESLKKYSKEILKETRNELVDFRVYHKNTSELKFKNVFSCIDEMLEMEVLNYDS